jgi:hypothetical protein
MYRIIGVDGKEYGPISAEQLRQWIAENRANISTRALAEGTTEWKPLGSFPEFALAFGSKPFQPATGPSGASPSVLTGMPTRRTSGFATTGMILGILSMTAGLCCCGLPFNILGLVFSLMALSEIKKNPQLNGKGMAIAGLVLSLLSVLPGLLKMLFFGTAATVFDQLVPHVQNL